MCKFPQRNSLAPNGPQPRAGTAGSGSILRPREVCWTKSSHGLSFLNVALFPHVILRGGQSGVGVLRLGSLRRYISVRSQFEASGSKSGTEFRDMD